MNRLKKYITSHQVSLALRVTFSIVSPPILFYYLHMLPIGAALSLGALGTSLTDAPGPPEHRRNGFYASIALNCLVAIITGFTHSLPIILGLEIVAFSFLLSYLSVFGTRAGSVGSMALLILILNSDPSRRTQAQVLENGLLIGLGGVWYAFLSLVLYRLFPYRLAQQAVGESIISTAAYMRTKARFYREGESVEAALDELLKEQVVLQSQQDQVRELLFKARRIVNDSTPKGRILLSMFLDSVDLFEGILSTQQDYHFLQEQLEGTDVLPQIAILIESMADELEAIGIAIQASTAFKEGDVVKAEFQKLQGSLEALKGTWGATHPEAWLSLQLILSNIKDIRDRMHRLSLYTYYDTQTGAKEELDFARFISHQPIDAQEFVDNLTIHSQVFRHAIRLSLAMLAGYIVSRILPFGHGYWILLSISVILKPLFGSTKKLYLQRLGGTLVGAVIGGVLLYYVTSEQVLLGLMILMMIVGYSLLRQNYFFFCILLTIFVLIAFHFLYHRDFKEIVEDRVIDTVIGSAIALVSGFIFIPSWSHETMMKNMLAMITAGETYFDLVARSYTGREVPVEDFKLARKDAFVALANLSDNFQRVLTEPRSKRRNVPYMHAYVVSSQLFVAHSASLAQYHQDQKKEFSGDRVNAIAGEVHAHLENARRYLQGEPPVPQVPRAASGEAGDAVSDQFVIIDTLSRDIENAAHKFAGAS